MGAMWELAQASGKVDWFETWNKQTVSETTNKLVVQTGANGEGYDGYITSHTWNVTDASTSVAIIQNATATGGCGSTIATEIVWHMTSQGYSLAFYTDGTNLVVEKEVNWVCSTVGSTAYNATNHKYLRIRHTSSPDKVYFDISSDGSSWTNQWNIATPFAVTTLYIALVSGNYCQITTAGNPAWFDDFNSTGTQN